MPPSKKRGISVDCEDVESSGEKVEISITTHPREKLDEWKLMLNKDWYFNAPEEFFQLHCFLEQINPKFPSEDLFDMLNLKFTGPFDAIATETSTTTLPHPVYLHGRAYYDPPEVVTVMTCGDSTYGYLRDAPKELPKYVVKGSLSSSKYSVVGWSLAGAILDIIDDSKNSKSDHGSLKKFLISICGDSYPVPPNKRRKTARSNQNPSQTQRSKDIVAPTLSELGIVVPLVGKTKVGYRELPVQGQSLQKLLNKPSRTKELDDLITRATIACDECDFGTSLQLGLDLWTQGTKFEAEAIGLMESAYMMLNRTAFGVVARNHIQHRRLN